MAQQTDISKMETTQTAVNWFVEQLPQIDWDDPFYVGLLQEANKMFEEQIQKAYDDGAIDTMQEQEGLDISMDQNGEESERYYKETYNK
jgi:hypothetical protein